MQLISSIISSIAKLAPALLAAAPSAYAESGGEGLSLEALSYSGDATYVSAVILLLLILLIVLAVWSGLSHALAVSPRTRRRVFLTAKVIQPGEEPVDVHLMSLDLRGALLVSPRALPRGARVKLDLGRHPDYPDRPLTVEAVVASHRAAGGQQDTHWLKVRFQPTESAPRRLIARYLESLGLAPGLSHA